MAATRYYQGKHKLAKTTFKIAKRYSPSVKMVARDKKLVEFFREEKQKTSFVVSSNATSATILLDGILAGNVGGNIDASAGIKKLIVSAPGYTSRSVRIKIKPNKINRYTVNLKKIQKAPARLVRQKPKRVKIKPLQSRDYYQAQRRVKVVMPKQDFIDRAEQDEFAVEAKKQIEAETARSYNAPAKPAPTYANPAPTYANPAPTYAQPAPTYANPAPTYAQPAPTYAQPAPTQAYPYSYGSGIYVAPPPPPPPVANPVPVPLYYQQPATYRAPAPQQDTTVTNAPVLLHH